MLDLLGGLLQAPLILGPRLVAEAEGQGSEAKPTLAFKAFTPK